MWLIEINSSPAVAEDLLSDFVEDMLEIVVDPFYPKEDSDSDSDRDREEQESEERGTKNVVGSVSSALEASEMFSRGFDLIYDSQSDVQ